MISYIAIAFLDGRLPWKY